MTDAVFDTGIDPAGLADEDLFRELGSLYRTRLLKWFCDRFLPRDRFQTLVWVIGWVVVAVAIKGFFEFWQESLVGSVVNLSLFDLRNRFYRNVIHLDVSQFNDQGTTDLIARFTNDAEVVGTGLKTIFGKMVAEPLKAVGCVFVAAWISWQLTLMFLILVPVWAFLMARLLGARTRGAAAS